MNDHEMLLRHDEQLKTLFNKLEDLTKLTESVNELAIAAKELAMKLNQQDARISTLEESTKFKMRTLWSCVATALVSAVITVFLTKIGA